MSLRVEIQERDTSILFLTAAWVVRHTCNIYVKFPLHDISIDNGTNFLPLSLQKSK